MEIWKKIEGYDGYEVSNFGRVRTKGKITHTDRHGFRHWKDRVLKQKITTNYRRVDLWKDGNVRSFLVHRLVASAFLGNPENDKMTVNHKDGNGLNNHIDNLEWVSMSDNMKHAYCTGLRNDAIKCSLISVDGEKKDFNSLSDASKSIGRNSAYISNCKNNNRPIKDKDGKTYILFE